MNSVQSFALPKARCSPDEVWSVGRSCQHTNFWIIGLGLISVVIKLVIAFNTIGSNDVQSFYVFGHWLSDHGLAWTYARHEAFNHPPLVAYFLEAIYRVSNIPVLQQNGFTFPFLLRLPGIISDFVVLLLLFRLRAEFSLPMLSLIVLALSPATIMISGFHGNTDSVMIMFLVVAAYMCVRERPVLCGLFLALSCQIKIVPLLLLPIFVCFWYSRRSALRFLLPFAVASIGLCLPALLTCPIPFVKNVMAYGSIWGLWGISFWLRLTGVRDFCLVDYHDLTLAENVVSTALKILIVAIVLLLAWRRRTLNGRGLFQSIAYAWIVFFIFTPGAAAQYLIWPMPFVILLGPPAFVSLTFSSSLFLFFLYNTLARQFPWYLAISTPALADRWAPWALWPWMVMIAIALSVWMKARREVPSLRLFSVETMRSDAP